MNNQNTWVIGDIHGAYKALIQIFKLAPIKKGDTIISLGDVVDGWSESYECVELLLLMENDYNMIFIRGNHDEIFNTWINTGIHEFKWTQGANATAKSYIKHADREEIDIFSTNNGYVTSLDSFDIPSRHQKFFRTQHLYYIDNDNNCFVHGGFNRHQEFKGQDSKIYHWDRDLWAAALTFKEVDYTFKMYNKFKDVFIGHTTTTSWRKNGNSIDHPMNAVNIWNLDTGAGFEGKLTIMNVNTKEYYQSDTVEILYKNEIGRRKIKHKK